MDLAFNNLQWLIYQKNQNLKNLSVKWNGFVQDLNSSH